MALTGKRAQSRQKPVPPAVSSMRIFKPTQERDGGVMRSVYRVSCASCGVSGRMVCSHPRGIASKEVVFKHFNDAGWLLGPDDSRTKCPGCVNAEEQARRADAERKANMARADEPRQMTYEEAKRVREAIKEVYLEDCYSGNENDETVAARLGFPPKFVREVRGTEFGSGENEASRRLQPQIEPIEKGISECKDMVDKAMTLLAEVDSRVIQLNASMRDLQKQASSIQKSLR